jgi:TRAP-type C4-dicarboxylate transport system permease small subunit
MQKLTQIIDKFSDIVSGLLQGLVIFSLMVMVLVEVLTRYIMNSPLSIADEIGGYMLVGITFLGLGYTWKEEGHVRVELITNLLPVKIRSILRFFTLLLATIFCIPLIAGSYTLLQDSLLFGTRSGSWMRIPMVYPQSLLLIGSILLLLQMISEILKAILGFTNNKEVESGV